ncbi:MAG: KGG domain-containing protein [Bacteroidota bacterium]|nr:KGG domain-containing protein [Bacteroidota bacterium]MDP4232594.1 KGG domain-containing protein [Bacteroidota bacterium]MDP4242952.1 KGG domain-containing protein [Bacteroidota bacterium]MDP4286473.1 KGG domain-containing protein [Bacteroidota bacterium]
MANTSKRGFASMNQEKQRWIASKGGRAAHAKGKAHEWSPEEARAAGRKGGESRGSRNAPRMNYVSESGASHTGIGEGVLGSANVIGGLASAFLVDAGSSLRGQTSNQAQPNQSPLARLSPLASATSPANTVR